MPIPAEHVFLHEIVTETGKHLILKGSTLVFAQREDCGGFSPAVVADLSVGDPIEYYYYMEKVDFSMVPNKTTLHELRVYNTNCPLPELETEDTNSCFTCWM